jgi:putative Mn2+ efflux pump MntP
LWQKVALLIGIGLFMIIAAFAYQKRNAQVNNESSDIINHT